MPIDEPPNKIPTDAEINWQANTVRDDWGEAGPVHRVLLIPNLRLREHWPPSQADAQIPQPAEPSEKIEKLRNFSEQLCTAVMGCGKRKGGQRWTAYAKAVCEKAGEPEGTWHERHIQRCHNAIWPKDRRLEE